VASLEALSDRLRAEIGDTSRSFIETFVGDGTTSRFRLTQAPVSAASLTVKVGAVDVTVASAVEEVTGNLQLNSAPISGAVVTVTGTTYKYFTDPEISYYINTAFLEHAKDTTDSNGSRVTQIALLPPIEEYPLVLLASSMALYTLATDAAFDIDIISPDGVSIPRSERFRQLNEIIMSRKEQYRELCMLLNVGMHRIEVTTLRRISRLTNKYVPVYRPQEIDERALPQRVRLNMPTYGDITPPSTALVRDLNMYSGDDFAMKFEFGFDLTGYTPKAQIRLFTSGQYAQIGPLILGEFVITKVLNQTTNSGLLDTLQLSLPASVTEDLPRTAYYDLQMISPDNITKTYLTGKVFTSPQVTK
jgi:hypothetical protein